MPYHRDRQASDLPRDSSILEDRHESDTFNPTKKIQLENNEWVTINPSLKSTFTFLNFIKIYIKSRIETCPSVIAIIKCLNISKNNMIFQGSK